MQHISSKVLKSMKTLPRKRNIIDRIMKKFQYTFGGNEENLDCNETMTVADLGRNLSHFNKKIYKIFFVEDSFFHDFAQQWGKCDI